MSVKNTLTICSFCSCGCGMLVRTENGEARGVIPSSSHPVSQGRLCHRGWNRFQNLKSVNRIRKPLWREGSELKEAESPEIIAKAGEKIRAILEKHGPEAIGVVGSPWLSNEDNFLAGKFARGSLATKNLDGSYRFGGAASLSALAQVFPGPLGSTGTIPALAESPAVLVVGRGSYRDFSPVGSRVMQAALRGAKVLLAEAGDRRTEHFFTLRIPVPPENLPAALAEKRDIPVELLGGLRQKGAALVLDADQYGPGESALALFRYFLEESKAADAMPALILESRSPNLRGAWDMGMRPAAGGLNLSEMLAPESKVRGILVFADDVLSHLPSPALVEKFKKLEFILVAERFLTETARIANCVLPLPLLAETEGTLTNLEGRVQLSRPALSPTAPARGLSDVLPELAQALGKSLTGGPAAEIRKEIAREVPGYAPVASAADLEGVNGVLLGTASVPSKLPPSANLPPRRESADKFLLLIPNALYRWVRNPMIMESPVLAIEYPPERLGLRINSQEARDRKFRPGEKVKVRAEGREIQLPLSPDENVPPRTLVLSSHFLAEVEGLAGKGTPDSLAGTNRVLSLNVVLEKS